MRRMEINTLQLVIMFIIGIAGSAGVSALVVGFFNKNKTSAESESLKAEATKTIRDAASAMVADYREDNKELRDRLDEMEEKFNTTNQQLAITQRQLTLTQGRLETATKAFSEAVILLKEARVDVSKLVRYVESHTDTES